MLLLQWNSHGYDIAKMFAKKFTHISPVWLQAKLNADESDAIISGKHDIDYQWMRDLRDINPSIKIGKSFKFHTLLLLIYDDALFFPKCHGLFSNK